MKQSFVKMMNRISEMENCILKGLVLDEHGDWVSIADRKAVEEDSLAHLSAGQVLFEGRWVSFTEVKTSRTRRIERPPLIGGIVSRKKIIAVETPATPAPAVQPSTVVGTPPGITIIVQSSPPPANVYSSAGTPPAPPIKTAPETVEAPPETKVIVQTPPPEVETRIIQKPPPSSEKATVAAPATSAPPTPMSPDMPVPPETAIIVQTPPPAHHEKDLVIEEYAPETKIILIRPPEQSTPSAPDTQILEKPEDTRFFHPPQITPPPPDESGHKLKNRMVLIAGTIVVIATIVAVLLIVVQTAR